MTARVVCPVCDTAFAAPEELRGAALPCPRCGASIAVPLYDLTSAPLPFAASAPLASAPSPALPPPIEGMHAGDDPLADHALLLVPQSHANHEDLIDMTAMVDIVFFLLIFFLVTSMQSIEAVMEMPPPRAEKGAVGKIQAADLQNDPDYVKVIIDGDNNIWLDDAIIVGEQNLRAALRVENESAGEKKGMLVIGAADATHGTLVTVFDAAADAGMTDLLFTVREEVDDL